MSSGCRIRSIIVISCGVRWVGGHAWLHLFHKDVWDGRDSGRLKSGVEADAKAFVDAAFAFVSHHADAADFASVRHMSAAIGLQVKPDYVDGANLFDGGREQVDFGADEVRNLKSFVSGQCLDVDAAGGMDLFVDEFFHLFGEVDRHMLKFEVHAGAAGLHTAAGNLCAVVAPDHTTEDVQCGVGTHEQVSAFPMECTLYGSADCGHFVGCAVNFVEQLAVLPRQLFHGVLCIADAQSAAVCGLPATAGVERRAVEHNPFGRSVYHGGLEAAQVTIGVTEDFSHMVVPSVCQDAY